MPRRRSATEALLSIVLALEALLVFFVTLAVFGLDVLPPGPAFIGGAALLLVLIVAGRLVRYRAGLWLAWALQGVLVATGFLVPLMFFIGAGFVLLFAYCFVTGIRLDRRNAGHADTTTNQKEEPR